MDGYDQQLQPMTIAIVLNHIVGQLNYGWCPIIIVNAVDHFPWPTLTFTILIGQCWHWPLPLVTDVGHSQQWPMMKWIAMADGQWQWLTSMVANNYSRWQLPIAMVNCQQKCPPTEIVDIDIGQWQWPLLMTNNDGQHWPLLLIMVNIQRQWPKTMVDLNIGQWQWP